MSLTGLLSVVEGALAHDATLSPSSSSVDSYSRSVSPLPDDDAAIDRVSRSEARSAAHLASEKKRRANINGGFESLRSVVPSCQPCHSKAEILRKAVDHIRSLGSQQRSSGSDRAMSAGGSSAISAAAAAALVDEEKDVKRRLNFALKYIECLKRQKDELQSQVDHLKRASPTATQLLPAAPQQQQQMAALYTDVAPQYAHMHYGLVQQQQPMFYAPQPTAAAQSSSRTETKKALLATLANRKRAQDELEADMAAASVLATSLHRPQKRAAVNS